MLCHMKHLTSLVIIGAALLGLVRLAVDAATEPPHIICTTAECQQEHPRPGVEPW